MGGWVGGGTEAGGWGREGLGREVGGCDVQELKMFSTTLIFPVIFPEGALPRHCLYFLICQLPVV